MTSSSSSSTSYTSAAVTARLLSLFETDTTGTKTVSYISSVPSSIIKTIITSLFSSTSTSSTTTTISLLRALWMCSNLRTSILLSFTTTSSSSLSSSSSSFDHHNNIIEQLSFLLVADARDSTKPLDQRLHAISHHANAIAKSFHPQQHYAIPILVLCARAALAVGTISTQSVHVCIIWYALLLLRNSNHHIVKQKGISALLDAELTFTCEQQVALITVVESCVREIGTSHETTDIIMLMKSSINYVTYLISNNTNHGDHNHTNMIIMRMAIIILALFSRSSFTSSIATTTATIPSSSSSVFRSTNENNSNHINNRNNSVLLQDLIVLLEVYVHDCPALLHPIVIALSSLLSLSNTTQQKLSNVSNDDNITKSQQQQRLCSFSPVHLVLAFALLNITTDESTRHIIHITIETLLTSSIDTRHLDFSQLSSSSSFSYASSSSISLSSSSPHPSSSSSFSSLHFWRQSALLICVSEISMHSRSDVLVRFFEGLLWRSNVNLKSYAIFVLSQMFLSIPSCREPLLRSIFACLSESHPSSNTTTTTNNNNNNNIMSVLHAYASIFTSIVSDKRSAPALVQCQSVLIDVLRLFFSFIPPSIACIIIKSFVSIASNIRTLIDPLLVFLRKSSSSRAHSHQYVAAAGYIAFLIHPKIDSDIVTEVANAITTMLDVAQPFVQASILHRLTSVLSSNNLVLSFNRIKTLSERVAKRLITSPTTSTICENQQQQQILDITTFFTLNNNNDDDFGTFIVRDPIPFFLRLCAIMQMKCPKTKQVFHQFVSYLCNVENGAIVDACAIDKSDIPPLSRILLLCSLLQTVLFSTSLSSLTSITTINNEHDVFMLYGITLIIRDFLARDTHQRFASTQHASWSMPLFQSFTAREGACSRNVQLKMMQVNELDAVSLDDIVNTLCQLKRNNAFVHMVESEIANLARKQLLPVCNNISSNNMNFVPSFSFDSATQTINNYSNITTTNTNTTTVTTSNDDDNITPLNKSTQSTHRNQIKQKPWLKKLIQYLRSSFLRTCPWSFHQEHQLEEETEVQSSVIPINNHQERQSKPIDGPCLLDKPTASRCTESTAAESSSCMRNDEDDDNNKTVVDVSDKGRSTTESNSGNGGDAGNNNESTSPSSHSSLLHRLRLRNDKVEKALDESRFSDLSESARISIRESCLKMILTLLSKQLIDNEWEFIKSLSSSCIAVGDGDDDDDDAMVSFTNLFRSEIASSTSFGLTASYLELMYLLLDRCDNYIKRKQAVVNTIMNILQEYSIKHVLLVKQMVKVLLKALDEKDSVYFGTQILDWLSNDIILTDSIYTGADDIKDTHLGVGEFDYDIVQEALRMDLDIENIEDEDEDDEDEDEDDGAVTRTGKRRKKRKKRKKKRRKVENNVTRDDLESNVRVENDSDARQKENPSERREHDDTQPLETRPRSASPSSPDNTISGFESVTSLCLNETADRAVASISCVLSSFTDKTQLIVRRLRQALRFGQMPSNNSNNNSKHPSSSSPTDFLVMRTIVDGIMTFLRSEFVCCSVDSQQGRKTSSKLSNPSNTTNSASLKPTRRRNNRLTRLAWPADLQKRFANTMLALMEYVDIQIRLLSRAVVVNRTGVSENNNELSVIGDANVCVMALRLVFEDENALIIMYALQDEWNRQWAMEERIENAATALIARWDRYLKNHDQNSRYRNKKKNDSSKDTTEEQNHASIGEVVRFVKRVLINSNEPVTKRRRMEWCKKHGTGESENGNNADRNARKPKRHSDNLHEGNVTDGDSDDEDINDDNEFEDVRALRTNKRQRPRSRNAYVDQYMLEDGEQESYVDLEDFIAQMHEDVN